jgi:hypothetical protein
MINIIAGGVFYHMMKRFASNNQEKNTWQNKFTVAARLRPP